MLDPIPESVLALIGQRQYPQQAALAVDIATIRNSCASVENANPLFWDESVAESLTRGQIAPASLLSAWMRPYHWQPEVEESLALQAHFDLKVALDLPEAIITANSLSFGEPVRVGDQLSSFQQVSSISEIKSNRLGTGRYWVVDVMFENQHGQWVGKDSYTAFGYRKEGAGS